MIKSPISFFFGGVGCWGMVVKDKTANKTKEKYLKLHKNVKLKVCKKINQIKAPDEKTFAT